MTTTGAATETRLPATLECVHLRAGITHSYIERDGRRYCLDCAAEIYSKTHDPRLQAIYYQVVEAHPYILARFRK